MTEEIKTGQTAQEATSVVESSRQPTGITGGLPTSRDERKAMVSWAASLDEALKKPSFIHEAYSRFHNYSLGSQLVTLFPCLERGIHRGRLAHS